MAKVSLRSYNREIGTLIDQGQLEEAVGHCNHILKTFPKHLETYRLLGKAYLEAKRYKDASDVFSRLLAAVPNDFVAHVGMSMIADETQNLDDAIWHMERAFEAQPSNAAVQSELQRLYGRRDGVQPPKIRMTSGALANVYIQGELYPQAIAEIMSVEARDPGRTDMQVLLALAYFRSGQRIEASKIASDILSKSPYSLDANRILVTILPETSRADSTQVYRHRVNALDPYAAFAKSTIFDTSDVPDAAISLERIDWQPGDTVFSDDSTLSDSSIQADATGNEQPDWLKNADTNADFGSASASEPPAQPAEDIPDFMRAAGWGASSGEEKPISFFDSPDPEPAENDDENTPIAQAELPEWMKNIAPAQAELESANEEIIDDMGDAMADDFINDLFGNESDTPEDKDNAGLDFGDLGSLGTSNEEQDAALNWLESLAANQGANPEELITNPNDRTENAPEWVQKAAETGNTTPSESPAEEDSDDIAWLNELGNDDTSLPTEEAAEPAGDIPDWLNDLNDAEESSDESAVTGDLPDWLNDIGGETDEAPAATPMDTQPAAEDDLAWMNEIADEETPAPATESTDNVLSDEDDDDMAWLNALAADDLDDEEPAPIATQAEETPEPPAKETSPAAAENAIADATIGTLGTSDADQDAAMNWLESLAANQGANPEELITDPDARTEAAPEWVQKAQDVSETAPSAPQAEAPAAEDDLAWMNEIADEETPAPATDSADDVPAEKDDDDMAWLNALAADDEEPAPVATQAKETPEPPAEETSPAAAENAIADATIGTLGTSDADQDAAMNWLESLAANQGANPEELITDPNARTEAAPEWVQKAQDVSETAPSAPQAEAPSTEEAPAAEDDLAWMNEIADEETPAPVTDSADDVPAEKDDDDMAWLNALAADDLDDEEPAPIATQAEETPEPPAEETSPAAAENAIADATIGTLGTSGADQDAAMNWLESLAANQGANPEELITDPNARTEAAPEWVQKAQDVSENIPTPAAPEEETLAEVEPPVAPEEAPVEENQDDDTPPWLRDDEDDVPAWLQDDEEETPAPSMSMQESIPAATEEAASAIDEEEEWLVEQTKAKLTHDAPEPMPSTPAVVPASSPPVEEEMPASPSQEEASASTAESEETPDWLKEMEAEEETAPAGSTDAPDWLKEMDEKEEPEAAPVAEAPAKEEEELPGWLASVNAEKETQAAASADFPDWLKEEEANESPVPPKAEPTKAEEWKPIAEKAPEQPLQELPPRRKVNRMNTTMLRDITLMSAQAAMREGNIAAAMAEYGKLIKKKRLLAETIYDLREALYDYPVDVSIWQLLGDAYMRAGQLQEAINAYTKAEELLR